MKKTFEYDNETFTLDDDADRWTLGETRAVERYIGVNLNEMLMTEQMTAALAISIKRQRPTFRIPDVDQIEMGVVLEMVKRANEEAEKEAESQVPPVAADDAADVEESHGSGRSKKPKG